MPLDTLEAIHARYSCRGFTDRMPPDEDLRAIAEAGLAAPSGMNRQFWRVIVVKNKELIGELEAEGLKNVAALPSNGLYDRIMSRGGKLFYNAPCIIAVPIARAEPAGAEMFDCGILAENIARGTPNSKAALAFLTDMKLALRYCSDTPRILMASRTSWISARSSSLSRHGITGRQ